MKIFKKIGENILFISTLFLLAFIPLYPKLPLLNIQHTWVYVRVEDFAVAFVILLWFFLLFRKRITLKTPLTIPILLFWIFGGISTLHGVLLIFPTISDVFSNVAFLSFLRRIEYISMFFISFAAIKDKKFIYYIIATLTIVFLLIIGYGFGQKFLGFPAFLTGNEEFAKGIPIYLSQLSRVPSTFAGHYDLAAYLVLMIPILASVAFGIKNTFLRIFLLGTTILGFVLLLMTVSRVSFFVLLLSLILLLLMKKKRFAIISLFILAVLFLSFSPSLLSRFKSTVSEVDVLVDIKTGKSLGQVKEVPAEYFKDKVILRQSVSTDTLSASSSAILPFILIPKQVALVVEANKPTGEDLPQGTGYVNLPLSPVTKRLGQYFYQKNTEKEGSQSAEIKVFYGDFLVKRAKAYDLSFTTRFQGEWPRTIEAFRRNIIMGSGYGSVSLAVDNDYLRILGESGLLGLIAFVSIFLVAIVYIKKILPEVDSVVLRSFVFGFIAGTFGLILNAVLIDVFEASKIAFTYWLLMGVTLGLLHLYRKENVELYKELKKIVTSTYAIVSYLFIFVLVLFSSSYNSYFVGDDFTWFRWVSGCCHPITSTILNYFAFANGFFYRPGAKLYFDLMYQTFWLSQTAYHLVSLVLHFSVAAVLFLISKRILKNYFLSAASAVTFIILSGPTEAVFWISATGFLFNALFALLGLLFFMYWKERGKLVYFVISVVFVIFSFLFHEVGIITPLLIILYDLIFKEKHTISKISQRIYFTILLVPILPYLMLRYFAHSHWLNGDYSYNLLKLPFNILGNSIGYVLLDLFGPSSLSVYEKLRNVSKEHILISLFVSLVAIFVVIIVYRKIIRNISNDEQKIVIFGSLFFIIALLPFLGLGNIASRYSYLSSVGFVIVFLFFLKKIFGYLISTNGRDIGITSIVLIAIFFSMIHLFQLQRIQTDWREAGEKSQRLLVSLNEFYIEDWLNRPMRFYFVNVPIRNGQAWVFPVGLNDAVWFAFRNDKIKVYQMSTLSEAFNLVVDPVTNKVFEFDSEGGVLEMHKPLSNK